MRVNHLLSSALDYFNAAAPMFYFFAGILKIVFLVVSFALLAGTIILLFKASWLSRRYLDNAREVVDYKSSGARRTIKEWQKITKRMETDIEAEYKLAVIEADGLLDAILAKMGYSGGTMPDKLKKIEASVLPDISGIVVAHKTRDNIVHDPDYKISLEEAKKIISVYEQALRDFEVF